MLVGENPSSPAPEAPAANAVDDLDDTEDPAEAVVEDGAPSGQADHSTKSPGHHVHTLNYICKFLVKEGTDLAVALDRPRQHREQQRISLSIVSVAVIAGLPGKQKLQTAASSRKDIQLDLVNLTVSVVEPGIPLENRHNLDP
jgi:hypothetical protein